MVDKKHVCSGQDCLKMLISDFEKIQSISKLEIPLHNMLDIGIENSSKSLDINIVESVLTLTKCSFDQRYREPILLLGGIETIAELIQVKFTETYLFKQECSDTNQIFPNLLISRLSTPCTLYPLLPYAVT